MREKEGGTEREREKFRGKDMEGRKEEREI